ncbi:YheC/D like ATP-grasp [Paenibacillus sp. 1_12]|uniref:YheC/YheD family endospore coat-associated protein n=1 Tax=Paenibacillus sp. 1_12 TaxID=1566278 RepID=UPI0008DF8B88|nr:YheC/YheD family protein [Paenibacillus sp. 1_12]SFM20173.1 YheC/D like ATP-grasp [Paenibacillus sp. 1_12]
METELNPFRHSLGIMTTRTGQWLASGRTAVRAVEKPPFGSRPFYRSLCVAGRRSGLNVFVFTPQGIDWLNGRTEGFIYEEQGKRWVLGTYPLPDAVYDRCFFTHRTQYLEHRTAVRRLQKEHHALFLGCGLKGKLEVQHMLEQDGRFACYLPRTVALRSMHSVSDWLREQGQLIVKPQSGSQGRGVLHVQRSETTQTFSVRGRDAHNQRITLSFADEAALLRWLRRFTARRPYLQQQYLLLQTQSGDAYDVRSLVQKDGTGRWSVTGMAVRRGQEGSLTSNLHGGGTALPVDSFLTSQFPSIQANMILEELYNLSELIPGVLESGHGQLAELGIDFGIDMSGHVWILEVNSKPGRSALTRINEASSYIRAVTKPIHYAHYLLNSRSPLISTVPAGSDSLHRLATTAAITHR